MLKKVRRTRLHNPNKRGKRVNKNIRQSRKQTKKQTENNISHRGGGCDSSYNNQIQNDNKKEKFQVTTFRSINQDDLDRFKISNYVNSNIDWGMMPGPPPTDCVIQ